MPTARGTREARTVGEQAFEILENAELAAASAAELVRAVRWVEDRPGRFRGLADGMRTVCGRFADGRGDW